MGFESPHTEDADTKNIERYEQFANRYDEEALKGRLRTLRTEYPQLFEALNSELNALGLPELQDFINNFSFTEDDPEIKVELCRKAANLLSGMIMHIETATVVKGYARELATLLNNN